MNYAERIIVALDVDTRTEAFELVRELRGRVGLFKVGNQLFTAEGPDLVREIVVMGERVFLDLKYHDIPNTVLKAALAAQKLGVSMMTLHAGGGRKMMSSVADAFRDLPSSTPRPVTLAVTVLTSLGDPDLQEVGCSRSAADQVVQLALLAHQSGMNGIVGSPSEVAVLRRLLGDSAVLVTPGIRPAGGEANDQIRIATPASAVRAGADYLVIGRPITSSPDPLGSLEKILEEMRAEL